MTKEDLSDKHGGMKPKRAQAWFRRLVVLALASTIMLALSLWNEWPVWWVGPASAFAFAEMSRRICQESRPDRPLGWRELLGVLVNPSRIDR